MKLKILCPQWGHEHLQVEDFLVRAKSSGYDGIDTWMPENLYERRNFIKLLDAYSLAIVSHQHQARGNNIKDFCKSLEYYLYLAAECNPLLINSHSGRDYFSIDEQLMVIDTAQNFAVKNNVRVVHETHRGRIGFCPQNAKLLFGLRRNMRITADFSHWVCVTESYLENFEKELAEGISRADHIHARVGFPQGPQIPDPRRLAWKMQVDFFLAIWRQIIQQQIINGAEVFTITSEFGPPPYMWTDINTNKPVTDQWDINVFMKDLLKEQLTMPAAES